MREPISDERLAVLCGALKGADDNPVYDVSGPDVLALLVRLEEAETSVGIMKALTRTPLYSHRALTEKLSQIIGARFGAKFMDPPDGGDVPMHEQVERMADALLAAEARLDKAEAGQPDEAKIAAARERAEALIPGMPGIMRAAFADIAENAIRQYFRPLPPATNSPE